MTIDFVNQAENSQLGQRVRAILGVPEEFLTDDIISSPIFITKADKYINKKISEYESLDKNLLNIAYVYYIAYLLCLGMYARLPKQMENLSTKTILQSIDWDSKALELLDQCNEIIDDAIEELGEDVETGNTFAVLTDESEYPNTTI
jgi:hypothetical protein